MLIHIGNGYLVRDRDIIGIFDIDGPVTPEITKKFLRQAEKDKKTASAVEDLPRSFVIEQIGEVETVILSHISSTSLSGRTKTTKKNDITDGIR